MKITIKVCLFIFCSCCSLHKGYSQVFFENHPVSPIFSQVQLAKFPQSDKNRLGYIFFLVKDSAFDELNSIVTDESLNKIRLKYAFKKFKKDKHRYANYGHEIDEIKTSIDTVCNAFIDSIFLTIEADKFKRFWSWRHFSIKQKFISRVPIYNACLINRKTFVEGSNNQIRNAVFDSSYVFINKQAFRYEGAVEINVRESGFMLEFSDPFLKRQGISHKVLFHNMIVKTSNKEKRIFYFPIEL